MSKYEISKPYKIYYRYPSGGSWYLLSEFSTQESAEQEFSRVSVEANTVACRLVKLTAQVIKEKK